MTSSKSSRGGGAAAAAKSSAKGSQPPEQPRPRSKSAQFSTLGDLFSQYELEDKGGYITKEFQDYGMQLAHKLGDLKHKSLYIKLAKNTKRGILERALSFVTDAENAKSKARLFMWKVKQLKEEQAAGQPAATQVEKPSLFAETTTTEKRTPAKKKPAGNSKP